MRRSLIVCLLVGVVCAAAHTRWATKDDATLQINDWTSSIIVEPSGQYSEEHSMEIEVLKEGGREDATYNRLSYISDCQSLEILEAYTVTKGKKYPVPFKTIEDKPFASVGSGFDQINQVLIVYPHVEVGSRVFLKYRLKTYGVPLDNHYLELTYWGTGCFWKKNKRTIRSAIPLHIKVNDPRRALTVRQQPLKGGGSLILIEQKNPLFVEVMNEPNFLNDTQKTWVSISSLNKWQVLAQLFAPGYEKVLSHPLPKKFLNILHKAQRVRSETHQINTVTSLLHEMLLYLSVKTSVKGRLWPRNFKTIDESHMGDCKDFSSMTVAILRKLGFTAHVALVKSGATEQDNLDALPQWKAFDHAIVRVVGKTGRIYWIDPTVSLSMAEGLFPHIAGKHALILDQERPAYEKIPDIDPLHNHTVLRKTITVHKDLSIFVDAETKFHGESALEMTGKSFSMSQDAIKEFYLQEAVGEFLEKDDLRHIILPNLRSRLVQDLVFLYKYRQKNRVKRTNSGYFVDLPPPFSLNVQEEAVSDLFLSHAPMQESLTYIIRGCIIPHPKTLERKILSPWVDVTRTCSFHKDGLHITDVVTVKQKVVSHKDRQTKTFLNFKRDLKRAFNTGLVLTMS